jgi:hypothetical protein
LNDPAEATVMQAEMAHLCRSLPAGRLLICGDDPLLASAAGRQVPDAQRLLRAAVQATPGGFRCEGGAGTYTLGMEVVGESAWFALQAAVVLGERLGLDAATIQAFLRRETGLPTDTLHPPPNRVASG